MPRPSRFIVAFALVSLVAAVVPARAEKADRVKPVVIDSGCGGSMDLLRQVAVYTCNVVVTKGTIVIHAERVEVSQTPDGYYRAVAYGSPSQHATFRQKRDEPNEWIEGEAERLEYDGKSDVIRFVNNASARHLHGITATDEMTGNLITYDSTTEVVHVLGGAPATVTNPEGRVRAVLTPKEGTAAALEAAAAASAAASATPLKTTPTLGEKK